MLRKHNLSVTWTCTALLRRGSFATEGLQSEFTASRGAKSDPLHHSKPLNTKRKKRKKNICSCDWLIMINRIFSSGNIKEPKTAGGAPVFHQAGEEQLLAGVMRLQSSAKVQWRLQTGQQVFFLYPFFFKCIISVWPKLFHPMNILSTLFTLINKWNMRRYQQSSLSRSLMCRFKAVSMCHSEKRGDKRMDWRRVLGRVTLQMLISSGFFFFFNSLQCYIT